MLHGIKNELQSIDCMGQAIWTQRSRWVLGVFP